MRLSVRRRFDFLDEVPEDGEKNLGRLQGKEMARAMNSRDARIGNRLGNASGGGDGATELSIGV